MLHFSRKIIITNVFGVVILTALFALMSGFGSPVVANNQRAITIHNGGKTMTVATSASTVGEVLKRAKVKLGEFDMVEPATTTPLIAPAYTVNVYRARPVTIIDGDTKLQVMTPYQSPRSIVLNADIDLHPEDEAHMGRIDDFIASGGPGLRVEVDRAVPVMMVLYGKQTLVRTQAETVGGLLKEKSIVLGEKDDISEPFDTPIKRNMMIDIWRDGVQTRTEAKAIQFEVETIQDADQAIGYRKVKTAGVKGKRMVTYQIELKNGKEINREEIQSVIVEQPEKEVVIVGAKQGSGLSKAKGVFMHTDSKGIVHRETYYDLPMNVVMGNCGGTYSVRADGAKVDQDGYILVAANLSRYPRCSVVETSLGLGRVYDTGGFASVHPDGFDLATDWSNYDKR